ncbi:unnamed protein product, partial [Darwinula stevensoni]
MKNGLYGVISAYLQYSVSTTVSMTQPKFLNFPAVTVCNLSPFPCSKVEPNSDFAKILGCESRDENAQIKNLTESSGNRTASTGQNTSKLYVSLTEEKKIDLMQDKDKFIRSCTYEGVDCQSLFFPYANTTYGSCYVFNLKLNKDNDTDAGSRKTVFPGPDNGP